MKTLHERAREEPVIDWKDSYKGKLWSTAVQKCFEAPFVEVAIQHLLQKIDEIHKKELTQAAQAMKEKCIASLPLEREQLDKDDPDNYEACFAVHGWNNALSKAHKNLSAITIDI